MKESRPEGAGEGPLSDDELVQLVDATAGEQERWLAYRAVVEIKTLRGRLDSARAAMIEAMDALESDDHDQHAAAFARLQDEFEGVSEEQHARAVAVFEKRLGHKPSD